jgi:hypothetical protein
MHSSFVQGMIIAYKDILNNFDFVMYPALSRVLRELVL